MISKNHPNLRIVIKKSREKIYYQQKTTPITDNIYIEQVFSQNDYQNIAK
jgi:hypothetical protein